MSVLQKDVVEFKPHYNCIRFAVMFRSCLKKYILFKVHEACFSTEWQKRILKFKTTKLPLRQTSRSAVAA